MKREPIKVSIPKPCSQHWSEMDPVEKGRYCASCQKTVIDFSALSDTEIINTIHAAAGAQVCGFFHPSQLNRPLVAVKPGNGFVALLAKRLASSLLFVETIVTTAVAQTINPKSPPQPSASEWQKGAHDNSRTIRGCVTDYITHKSLAGLMVSIKGTGVSAITGSGGIWSLRLPDTVNNPTITLQVSYTPHSGERPPGTIIEDQEVTVDASLFANDLTIYRYPFEEQKWVSCTEFKAKLIDRDNPGMTVMTGETEVIRGNPRRKHSFHLFNWLKKKPKS